MDLTDAARVANAIVNARAVHRGWLRVSCVLCPDRKGTRDKKESLGVRADTGHFHCFRCGARGRIDGAAIPDEVEEVEEVDDGRAQRLPDDFFPLWDDDSMVLRPARRYLRRRRVPRRAWRDLGIGACPSGKYAGRVVVPVAREEGGLAGWVARAWGPSDVPYLYPPGMERVVFNAWALRRPEMVLLVEGVFDALPHWPIAAAFLGKPTGDQIERLVQARRPVTIVLDGDAWREGLALAMELTFLGVPAGALRLDPGTDPAEYDTRTLLDAAARCVPGEVARAQCRERSMTTTNGGERAHSD